MEYENHKCDTNDRVHFYEQEFYPFSNFSAFKVKWIGGRVFGTSEEVYHWERFYRAMSVKGYYVCDKIRNALSAHDVFKIAQENKKHQVSDWDDVKVGVMKNILIAKLSQHPYIRKKLFETGDREIVEDSWRDSFWGWGENRDGKNQLGRLWMEIREEKWFDLRNEYKTKRI